MKFTVERLPNEKIVVFTFGKDYQPGKDSPEMVATIAGKLGADETGVYVVYDARDLKMSFGDLVIAMANQAQKAAGTMADTRMHPVTVGTSEMLKLGNAAFAQEQYGGIKIPMFDSIEAALQYARDQLQSKG
jgi:hypothetical protein